MSAPKHSDKSSKKADPKKLKKKQQRQPGKSESKCKESWRICDYSTSFGGQPGRLTYSAKRS
jgi:hypothetical protein